MKNVSIIVPIYKDWETIRECIESLKKCVDQRHKILLVNDIGPEWKQLEKNIKNAIHDSKNFYYYRNSENLGFVKTCNRAVFELDDTDNDVFLLNSDTVVTEGFLEELIEVLYSDERHGVVCPRSNNATILTVPVKNNLGREIRPQESYKIYNEIKNSLPRWEVIPTGVGFAMLIRRSLIKLLGLFDEVYGLGYNEENDFCMRMNGYGYNVVMANGAYVFHFESKSFGSKKSELDETNAKILRERYPHYDTIVNLYFNRDIHPIDYYADLLVDNLYEKKRILISLYEMPSAYNGTAQHGLEILKNFYNLYNQKYDISVLINRCADDFFCVSEQYPNVFYPDTITGTFHLAYIPSQIFNIEHLFVLNRVCLKYVFCMQDIISIRSNYLLIRDRERLDVFRKSIKYCDAMTTFSQYSLDDARAFYYREFEKRNIKTRVIYLGSAVTNAPEIKDDFEKKFEEYFIVIGNSYKHKFLKETINQLKNSKYNFIVIGAKEMGYIDKNIYGYQSGGLESEFISYLIFHSKGIIFPSIYEGFGLPILDGIVYDKKIVVNDNALNREQQKYMPCYSNNIFFFKYCEELEGLLDNIWEDPKVTYIGEKRVKLWNETAQEVEAFLEEILEAKVDTEILKERWEEMRYLENIHRMYVQNVEQPGKRPFTTRVKNTLSVKFPGVYHVLRGMKNRWKK